MLASGGSSVVGSGIRIFFFLGLIVHDSDVFGFGEVVLFDIWGDQGLFAFVRH